MAISLDTPREPLTLLPRGSTITRSSRFHQSLAHEGRRAQDIPVLQAHRQIAIGRRHQAGLVQHFAEADNLVPVLLLGLHEFGPECAGKA